MAQTQIVPFNATITAPYQIWVGSPAVPLSGANFLGVKEILVSNVAGQVLFWGSGTAVNQTNGQPLYVGDQLSIPIGGSLVVFGAGSGTGSCDIRITGFA